MVMNLETGKEINTIRQGFTSKKDAELFISRLKVKFNERGYKKTSIILSANYIGIKK